MAMKIWDKKQHALKSSDLQNQHPKYPGSCWGNDRNFHLHSENIIIMPDFENLLLSKYDRHKLSFLHPNAAWDEVVMRQKWASQLSWSLREKRPKFHSNVKIHISSNFDTPFLSTHSRYAHGFLGQKTSCLEVSRSLKSAPQLCWVWLGNWSQFYQ